MGWNVLHRDRGCVGVSQPAVIGYLEGDGTAVIIIPGIGECWLCNEALHLEGFVTLYEAFESDLVPLVCCFLTPLPPTAE